MRTTPRPLRRSPGLPQYIAIAFIVFLALFSGTLVLFHSSLPNLSPDTFDEDKFAQDFLDHDVHPEPVGERPEWEQKIGVGRKESIRKIDTLNCDAPQASHPQVNDNYCDCVGSGTDETSTSACSAYNIKRKVFQCPKNGAMIYASRIDDGVCDCCDGSDELHNDFVVCPNTCPSLRGEGFI